MSQFEACFSNGGMKQRVSLKHVVISSRISVLLIPGLPGIPL